MEQMIDVLVRNPEGTIPLGKPKHNWEIVKYASKK
jgi:hypothetical protein